MDNTEKIRTNLTDAKKKKQLYALTAHSHSAYYLLYTNGIGNPIGRNMTKEVQTA